MDIPANTEANPFARANNVTFSGSPWTNDISHGRNDPHRLRPNLEISPCHMRYLYQAWPRLLR